MPKVLLKDVCKINQHKQVEASLINDLISDKKDIALLPSSQNYGLFTSFELGDKYKCMGEVITLGRARYANIKYHNGHFISSNNIIVESSDPQRVLTKYIYYFLLVHEHEIYIEKTTYPVFDQNLFNTLEIDVPNMDQQQQIVDICDNIYGAINEKINQNILLDELVKSRFIELFGTVKNNHQEYPVIKISGCAKLQGGFAFKSSDYLDNGIRLVQISNVNKDTLDWDSINCVPQTFLQKYKDFELHVGDLVLAMTRPVIKSLDAVKIATVSENDVPSLLNQRVGRFIIDKTKINSTYLMLCCQMTEFREYVEAMSGNSLQPNISSKQVEDYSIVLPPLELQEQFAAFVEQTDKSKLAVTETLKYLEELKASLMDKYFN